MCAGREQFDRTKRIRMKICVFGAGGVGVLGVDVGKRLPEGFHRLAALPVHDLVEPLLEVGDLPECLAPRLLRRALEVRSGLVQGERLGKVAEFLGERGVLLDPLEDGANGLLGGD